jgi:hypothetical protein
MLEKLVSSSRPDVDPRLQPRPATKRPRRLAFRVLSIAAIAVALFHVAWPPIYSFPEPTSFAGAHWYDPYRGTAGPWLRANFHAHSRTWCGIVGGELTLPDLRGRYQKLGYDVIGISDYQSIAEPDGADAAYIPVYEHGFGLTQQHQTVMGPSSVSWFEFPLLQGLRQKQYVIDRLAPTASVLVLNHPNKYASYTCDDFRRLTGYTGIEIASRYAAGAQEWDAALSAGRPVWGFCSDDSHDPDSEYQIDVGWIMIRAERTHDAIVRALQRGAFYGVNAKSKRPPNAIVSCGLDGDVLRVRCAEPAELVRFCSNRGLVEVAHDTDVAEYRVEPGDAYVRAEVVNRNTCLYSNPILRCESSGDDPPAGPVATVDTMRTAIVRVAAALTMLSAVAFVIGVPLVQRR